MREGWEKRTIGQCFKVKSGDFLPKKKMSLDGNVDVYGGNGIAGKHNESNLSGENILIGRVGAKCGNVKRVSESIWLTDNAFYISEWFEEFDLRFLEYLLTKKDLRNRAKQTAQPVISSRSIRDVVLCFPSLSEQKLIVAILDEVFAGIDDAIANTEKNLTNARDLFESYLNEVFTHKDQKWMEKELSEIVEPDCSLSYGIVQPGEEYEKGLPIVRPTDLKTKIIILKELKRIDPLLAESYKRTQMQGGELLLCVRGSTGMVGLAADELTGGNVTRGIVPIRFKKSNVLQSFGYYALISKPVQDQITEKTYGAALMQINIRDVRKISIAFPTKIEEQQLLLENLGLVEEKTQRLEAIYQQKLTALNELKQSILQKAFTGELTADATSQAEKVKEEIAA